MVLLTYTPILLLLPESCSVWTSEICSESFPFQVPSKFTHHVQWTIKLFLRDFASMTAESTCLNRQATNVDFLVLANYGTGRANRELEEGRVRTEPIRELVGLLFTVCVSSLHPVGSSFTYQHLILSQSRVPFRQDQEGPYTEMEARQTSDMSATKAMPPQPPPAGAADLAIYVRALCTLPVHS